MVNDAGEGNCQRITHHLLVGRYCPIQLFLCPCRDGKEERGEEALAIGRPDWLPTGFAGTRFLPATGSPVRAVRPLAWPAPLVLLPVLGVRGGTGLRGLDSRDC